MTRWWQSRVAVAWIALLATIPLWFVRLPPLIDLLGHMGRYHVQLNLGTHPLLAQNWAYHWRLVGNLGCDLLMEPLGRLLGVERGALILAASLPPLMIWGMARLARAAHGFLPATAWAAFPFAMAYPWHYGLVNYWLGAALALHAAATAIALEGRAARPFYLGLASLALWVVHIYGWAIFGVLIAARAAATTPWRKWPWAALHLVPTGLPVLLMIALSYGSRGQSETYGWFMFERKLGALLFTLRDQFEWLDIGCLSLALVLVYATLRSRQMRFDAGLATAALALFAAVIIIPFQALGSAFADGRLWPLVFIVALLATAPRIDAPPRLSMWIASGSLAIFLIRITATTTGFMAYDAAYARHLRALDHVEPGAHVAVLLNFPCEVDWRRPRLDHLDGIAIVRRDAFTNGQWNVPGAQTLVPLGARGTAFNADPSELVRRRDCPDDLRPVLARRIAALPRDRFDRVWIIGFAPATLPRYPGLTPLFADEATILYRIDK